MDPMTMSDRYHRGVETMQCTGLTGVEAIANRVAELAPDFARMAIEFPYGDVYSRPGLDLPVRETVAIAALAARGDALPQLRTHVAAALHLGLDRDAIIEILMQIAVYAGFPAAMNALAGCHDLLRDGQACGTSCQSADAGAGQS